MDLTSLDGGPAAEAGRAEPMAEAAVYSRSMDLMGGTRFARRAPTSRAEVHATIVRGVPYASLMHLLDRTRGLDAADVAGALGVSSRTLRRQADMPERTMPADLASKAWLLAEIVAKAAAVMGGQQQAEAWLSRPAAGLGGERPIDLLKTLQGAEEVGAFLTRLDYGVYT